MIHFKAVVLEWIWIITVGLVTTQYSFKDDLHKIGVTVISMALGTLVSYWIKRVLAKIRKSKSKNTDDTDR